MVLEGPLPSVHEVAIDECLKGNGGNLRVGVRRNVVSDVTCSRAGSSMR